MNKDKKKKSTSPMGRHPGRKSGAPVEKPKDFKGTFKRLSVYLTEYKFLVVLVLILSIASTIFTILAPNIMGLATTKLFEGMKTKTQGVVGSGVDYGYIGKILTILAIMYLLSAIFGYFQRYVMTGITQRVVYNLRTDIDEKLSKLPLRYYDNNQTGDILSRVTNDIDNISSTLQQTLTQLITSVISVIGIAVMMIIISPFLTLVTIAVLPLGILATSSIAKKSQAYFIAQSNNLGDLNGHIEEMYSGHNIIKAFGREKYSIEEFNNINEELYEASYKAQFISGIIRPIMSLINNIGYVVVSVVGGFLVINGKIDIGQIQAFIQYSRQFNQPIIQAADIVNTIQSTIASAERVFQILDEEEEVNNIKNYIEFEKLGGTVEFRDMNFSYSKDEKLIENMNIKVDPGDTVAIVGPTGAGKTTLVNLLMRFYEVDSGEILVDGKNITEINRSQLRNIFGMVLQDTWLFKGTIKENIAYGKEEVTDEEVIRAAKMAQADYFINTLPDGYETVLGEDADNISQGQKQLLTIARAILVDPKIMILDEATSSVDTRTEILIQKAMNKVMEGRTSFVIAHRLSTIKKADIILVMNEGKIIEQGNHEDLMMENGFYADLYNSQFAA